MTSARRGIVLISVAAATRSVWANQPPEPPVALAELAMAPLAVWIFVATGAAQIYDRKIGKPGRRWIPITVSTLLTLFSGVHEGMAVLVSPVLAIYPITLALRMLRLGADEEDRVRGRILQIGGCFLIPLSIFLAGFSWAYVGTYSYSREHFAEDLKKFHEYQHNYALAHEGKFAPIPLERPADNASDEDRQRYHESHMFFIANGYWYGVESEVTYAADLSGYQVRVTPVKFLSWPYRVWSPRRAYFMRENGVIRYETSYSAETQAGEQSPVFGGIN